MQCFVLLVSQCFGDIVVEQNARNILQCNIPCNGQKLLRGKLQELLLRVELRSTFPFPCSEVDVETKIMRLAKVCQL